MLYTEFPIHVGDSISCLNLHNTMIQPRHPLSDRTSTQQLNKLFPDYHFLRDLSAEQSCIETFWCFYKPNSQHHKITIFPFEAHEQESIDAFHKTNVKAIPTHHPNLVHIEDAWQHQNHYYISEIFNNAHTLRQNLKGGRLSLKSTLNTAIQLFDCLAELHEHSLYHLALSPDTLYHENAHLKLSPPRLSHFLEEKGYISHSSAAAYQKQGEADPVHRDLFAAGGVLFFLHSGHEPDSMDPELLNSYQLDATLLEIIQDLRAPQPNVCAKSTLIRLRKLLAERFPARKESENILTKLLKIKATRRLTPSILNPIPYEPKSISSPSLVPSNIETGTTIADRFVIQQWIEQELFDHVYSAADTQHDQQIVWLHLLPEVEDINWKTRFMVIAEQLGKLHHPHISQLIDANVLPTGAYMATQREDGEKLRYFLKRHRFTYPAVYAFSLQILSGLIAAGSHGFDVFNLSAETITVYKDTNLQYHYRLTSVGHTHLMNLSRDIEQVYKGIMRPDTLPPELYQLRPMGHLSTQYIFANILFELLFHQHPYAEMSFIQANEQHLTESLKTHVQSLQSVPQAFKNWLMQLLSPDASRRFPSLETALQELQQCPSSYESSQE